MSTEPIARARMVDGAGPWHRAVVHDRGATIETRCGARLWPTESDESDGVTFTDLDHVAAFVNPDVRCESCFPVDWLRDREGEATVPVATLVDEGLLHHWNRTVFWPLGLTLSAAVWDEPDGDRWPFSWASAKAEVLGGLAEASSPEVVIDAMESAMARRIIADPFERGLALLGTTDGAALMTALPEPEAERKNSRAIEWLRLRKASLTGKVREA